MAKLISIIIPVYNEEGNIRVMSDALDTLFKDSAYETEQIFVDDGSTDNSAQIVHELSAVKKNVFYVGFSRNFGKDNAVSAGLQKARGAGVITMDADLQHPPEMIPGMLELWEQGNEVVYTFREKRNEHAGKANKYASGFFYHTINRLSDLKLEDGISDFRLLDRKVVDVLNSLEEDEPFFRGLVKWVGFRQKGIPYNPSSRLSGETKYSKRALASLAIKGITSFSVKPLKIAIYIGFFFSFVSILYIPYIFISLYLGYAISGWASMLVTIVFFGGLQLMILGIIGIYLGKLFIQSKRRPHYVIKEASI